MMEIVKFCAVAENEVRRCPRRPGLAGLTWHQVIIRVHAVRMSHGALLGDHAVCGYRYATAGFAEELAPWPAGPAGLRCPACSDLLAEAGIIRPDPAPQPAADGPPAPGPAAGHPGTRKPPRRGPG